jgi:hypothetical protein
MTSFTRASRASAGRARGLRARLSSFSAVRGPVGLLYAPNVRGTAWATGFLSWRRGNVTLTQSRPSATFSHIIDIVYRPTIDRDRYEIIPRGRHRARGCVVSDMLSELSRARPAGGARGRRRGHRVGEAFPGVRNFYLLTRISPKGNFYRLTPISCQ